MKLHLPDFKVGIPKQVQHTYDPKRMDIEFVDLKYTRHLELDGTVEKGADTLTFRGQLTSEIERLCGRCLAVLKSSLREPFEFYYPIKEDQEELDTTDDVREALVLEHPIAFACSEDCRGLCPNCGVNLNETTCNCRSQFRSTPFSSLKKLRPNDKERKRYG